MELYIFLSNIAFVTSILALLMSIWVKKNSEVDSGFLLVFFILGLTVFVDAITNVLFEIQDYTGIKNGLSIYNLYYTISYVAWMLLFYKLIKNRMRNLIPFFVVFFLIAVLIEAVFFLDYMVENLTYPHTIGSLSLTIAVVLYFIQILQDGSFDALKDNLYFWLGCGLLINYLGILPFRMVSNYFTFSGNDIPDSLDYFFFNLGFFFSIIMYLIFCVGLYRHKKNRQ